MIQSANFDPQVVAKHGITGEDLDRVVRYLRLLQGPNAPTLADIALGGYYGTAALLHEVVELRILLEREPELLQWNRNDVRAFWHLNGDAHVAALVEEYTYLQRQIKQILGEEVSIGALLWVNADEYDFSMLAASGWPGRLLVPDAVEVDRAKLLLARLRRYP